MKETDPTLAWGKVGVLVWCAMLLASGCITPTDSANFPPPLDPNRLVLESGDKLNVLFTYWPELNVPQTIRPDGKITLHLVGEVQAAGRTPEELRGDLLAVYADQLKQPEISVVVEKLDSRKVYVGGEVRNPGVIELVGKRSVAEAIIEAGGFNNFGARLHSVMVVRERDGKRYTKIVNLKHDMSQPEHEPVYLEPHDIVYVPRTFIDRVDQAFEQYLNRVLPNNIYWNVMTTTNQQDIGDTKVQAQVGL